MVTATLIITVCAVAHGAHIANGLCNYVPTPPVASSTDHGRLFRIKDNDGAITSTFALHLWGNERQRGIAHGYLLSTQIIDWLEFYLIQTIFKGSITAYSTFYKFVATHLTFPFEFITEIDGIIEGMHNSKKSLIVPSLNRAITAYDIMAMNSYLEVSAQIPGPFLRAPSHQLFPACTQFIASGAFTLDHHLLTARNMDGETDSAKVTVTHLIVFAIENPDAPRIISFLWPGFVGSLSGMNEHGVYVMMNTGNMNVAPVIGDVTPISVIARSILNSFVNSNFTSSSVQGYVIHNFASAQSSSKRGTSGGGAILVCACDEMFTLEMDRLDTVVRKPMESPDLAIDDAIMSSNHFRKYGVDVTMNDPVSKAEYMVFNMDVRSEYYNSSWRYETGRSKMYAYNRTKGYVDVDAMKDILRSVSHGTTEHSIITQTTDEIHFWFAVADPKSDQWDAPYETYYHFTFDSLFDTYELDTLF